MVGLSVHVLFSAMEAIVDALYAFLSYGGHVIQPGMHFKIKYRDKAITEIGKWTYKGTHSDNQSCKSTHCKGTHSQNKMKL